MAQNVCGPVDTLYEPFVQRTESNSHVEALREYPDGVEVSLETRQEGRGHRIAAIVPLPKSCPGFKLPIRSKLKHTLKYAQVMNFS